MTGDLRSKGHREAEEAGRTGTSVEEGSPFRESAQLRWKKKHEQICQQELGASSGGVWT